MKYEVSRPLARFDGNGRRVVCGQRSGSRVELIDQHLVQAKVTCERQTVLRVGRNEVRVRSGLTAGVYTRALMLNLGAGFAEFAILTDSDGRDAAAPVIRYQKASPCLIQRQMTRARSFRSVLIQ